MAKSEKKPKGKKKKKGNAGAGVSVAGHPRAAGQVRRAKGFGGILFFAISAYYSHRAGLSPDRVALRALVGGIAGYMFAWACSVTVWRHLVVAELRAAVERGEARFAPAGTDAAPSSVDSTPGADGGD